MEILDNTLEEFVELFQGSATYFGASKPLGQTRSRDGKQEFKHWVEPRPMTREDWLEHLKGEKYYGSAFQLEMIIHAVGGSSMLIVIIYSIRKLYRLYGKGNIHSSHSDQNPTDSI